MVRHVLKSGYCGSRRAAAPLKVPHVYDAECSSAIARAIMQIASR
jgi:hypothetical protein